MLLQLNCDDTHNDDKYKRISGDDQDRGSYFVMRCMTKNVTIREGI